MSIEKMAARLSKIRKCHRPLTLAETEKFIATLTRAIVPINYKMSFLPMSDLVPEENRQLWN